jgi:hypothetical protein
VELCVETDSEMPESPSISWTCAEKRYQRPSKPPAQAYRPHLGVTSRAVTDTFVLDGPPHLVPSSVKRTTPRWLYATGQERSHKREGCHD